MVGFMMRSMGVLLGASLGTSLLTVPALAEPQRPVPSAKFTQEQILRLTPDQLEDYFTPTYHRCMSTGDAAQGVTAGMMDCLGLENDRQDAALNAAYKRALARQSRAGQAKLRVSQRAWLKQRDPICVRSMGGEKGGSMGGLIYSNCILQEQVRRKLWLNAQP